MEFWRDGQQMCALANMPESHANSRPMQPLVKVAYNLMLMQEASLSDLARITILPQEDVLSQISTLRREFGIRGNRVSGYKLSKDLEKRVALSEFIEKEQEKRFAGN